ncbi:HEAT repeat domain-containing protein [Collimonas pratensis]|uniref:HEAT repeats family protein n=1 Tax=Collimonas pratensis TaxID=279113 RepID=A0ABN4MAX3_9BURK|nr:HEAT repeat domain-containing protein [Collimonas pratensis]AMP13854.1 HEAT repeats family protein [Collimonas pratensis]
MKLCNNALRSVTGIVISIAFLSGCAINMKVPIKDPVSSTGTYDTTKTIPETVLLFKDEQSESDKAQILSGTIPMQMVYQDKPFDAVPWIAKQTVKEMNARNLPVKLAAAGENGTGILIKRIHIENHRVSSFSPFVTFTSLRADVETADGPQRVTAYIKRAKVPVWSFDEIIDPTYNDSLSLLIKELAAKINQKLFHQMVSTETVTALIDKINKDGATRSDSYLDVYQLGFSNNPAAIPELVKLSSHSSEYVRLAALSSLGILKATDQLKFLTDRYESTGGIWQDRAMALKAIGDLGTPDSQAYLQKQRENFKNKTDKEARWTNEIIALYL